MVAFFDFKNDHFDLRMVANLKDAAVKDLCYTPAYNKTLCSAPYALNMYRVFNMHTACEYLDEWHYEDNYIQLEWCEKPFDAAKEGDVAKDNFAFRRTDRLWYETWEDSEIDFEDYCYNNPDYEVKHRFDRTKIINICKGEVLYSPQYEDFYIFHYKNSVRVYCPNYGIVYHKWTDKEGYKHCSLTFDPDCMEELPSALAYINTLA